MAGHAIEVRQAEAPEPMAETGPAGMHIEKRYGKYHGHVTMHDGTEHHAPPAASFHEAHAALMPHLGMAQAEPEPEMEEEGE